MPVIRLGYIQVRVTDMEEAVNHYSNTLGHEDHGDRSGRPAYVATRHKPREDDLPEGVGRVGPSLVGLEEGGVGLVKFGYKVTSTDDLAAFEQRVQRFGTTTQRMSKGENLAVGDGIRVTLPVRPRARAVLRDGLRGH